MTKTWGYQDWDKTNVFERLKPRQDQDQARAKWVKDKTRPVHYMTHLRQNVEYANHRHFSNWSERATVPLKNIHKQTNTKSWHNHLYSTLVIFETGCFTSNHTHPIMNQTMHNDIPTVMVLTGPKLKFRVPDETKTFKKWSEDQSQAQVRSQVLQH